MGMNKQRERIERERKIRQEAERRRFYNELIEIPNEKPIRDPVNEEAFITSRKSRGSNRTPGQPCRWCHKGPFEKKKKMHTKNCRVRKRQKKQEKQRQKKEKCRTH